VEQAFQVGALEFISKPIRWSVLRQRLKLLLRAKRLEEERARALQEVQSSHDRLAYERRIVEKIIVRMRRSSRFDRQDLRLLMAPVERTAGDLVLSMKRPDGVAHLLVGDFTGHGLPAALGGPVVADLFYDLTERGASPQEILVEINRKLYEKLPTGLFLAVAFLCLDRQAGRCQVWNGGLPEVLWFRDAGCIGRCVTTNVPLGIIEERPPEEAPCVWEVQSGDRLFLFTDGVVETTDPDGRMFGLEGMEGFLSGILSRGEGLAKLHEVLHDHSCHGPQGDDLTVVDLVV
ncbi:MAG: serine/threonine-protein phosphatase, partial [Magnetococcales bacterium]|nr:serine/threonine-protein phosphatase [Magnetococcales bacterium]